MILTRATPGSYCSVVYFSVVRVLLVGRSILWAFVVGIVIVVGVLGSGCTGGAKSGQGALTTARYSDFDTATVRITGTSGTPFKGSYSSTSTGGQSVEGKVPQDYEVTYIKFRSARDTVRAEMQKLTDDDSRLTTQIIVDGEIKKEQSTGTDFGVVAVSWSPSER